MQDSAEVQINRFDYCNVSPGEFKQQMQASPATVYARCECHECTQARYKMSGQLSALTETADPTTRGSHEDINRAKLQALRKIGHSPKDVLPNWYGLSSGCVCPKCGQPAAAVFAPDTGGDWLCWECNNGRIQSIIEQGRKRLDE